MGDHLTPNAHPTLIPIIKEISEYALIWMALVARKGMQHE